MFARALLFIAAFLAVFLDLRIGSANEWKFQFPPPIVMRGAQYPCWPGDVLTSQFSSSGMEVVERGVMSSAIDVTAPLVEVWKSEKHFAVVAIYPGKKVTCAFIVGAALDGI